MKLFFIKTILLIGLVIAIIFMLALCNKPNTDLQNNYAASIIDKHARLDSISTKRVILAGGSNVAFGINSSRIDSFFKNYGTINISVSRALGLPFILHELESEVKKDDIILLCLEYQLFNTSYKPELAMIEFVQRIYPRSQMWYELSLKEQAILQYQNFRRAFKVKSHHIDEVYNRNAFNAYGDIDTPFTSAQQNYPLDGQFQIDKIKFQRAEKLIIRLQDKCQSVGARLVIFFPPLPQEQFTLNAEKINLIERILRDNLPTVSIVGKPRDFVYDENMFYDTVYHLNRKGRELRTQKLMSLLQNLPDINDE